MQGVNVRVMDPFTVKPLDGAGVQEHAAACGGRVVTVEDHYPEGGLGDAVLAALATCRNVVVRKLAVTGVPRYRDMDVEIRRCELISKRLVCISAVGMAQAQFNQRI
jgi:transketolase C-terminal domain/subunit